MLPIKTTLFVNGISSGVTGVALVAFAGEVASLFGLSSTIAIAGAGWFLIAFSLLVLGVGISKSPSAKWVRIITTLDILWVVTSLIVVVVDGSYLLTIGNVMILAVAAWVALMAVLQSRGVRLLSAM